MHIPIGVVTNLREYITEINIYVNQPDTHCFMIEFIHNIWWLDMFQTSMVHPQERLQAVCCEATTTYYLDISSSKQITTYQIRDIQLVNAPEDGPLRSETCRAAKCYE